MCEVVQFYDRWANGAELRVLEMLAGRAPERAPAYLAARPAADGAPLQIDLARYEAGDVALPQLDAEALAPVTHVLVHGSMATRDACGFSDVDIAVIVDDLHEYPAQAHRNAIFELRRLLRAALGYDALMHHGLMFFSASGMEHYDQRFLPVETLRCARVLHGPREVRLRLADAPPGAFAQSLKASAASLRRRVQRRDFLANDYQLKSVLSGSLLMPARVLAAMGRHVYKRDSFELARELFTAAEWEFVARCEALRALWVRPPAPFAHRHAPARSHPQLRQVLGARMAPHLNVRRLSATMIEGFVTSANAFLDRVEHIA